MAAQPARPISNLEAVLAAAGLTLAEVVKTTVYLADIDDFAGMNEIYASRFTQEVLPARSSFEVAELPRGAIVDVAPTVLYYLGLPVGRDMDGFARSDMFVRSFRREHPVTYISTHER